jgi:hypothetical protein
MADLKRMVTWPGSMPAGLNAREAWSTLLTQVGPLLTSVPPPETGAAADWIVPYLLMLRNHPSLEEIRQGDWSDYDHGNRYQVKPGYEFVSGPINVGIVDSFVANATLFRTLRREFDLPEDIPLQLDVKGVFDFAFFAFGPGAILTKRNRERYMRPFLDATLREMRTVLDRAGQQPVIFQLSVPVPTIFECKIPAPFRRLFTGWLAASVVRIAAEAPTGSHFGCHLCLGDLGHKAKARPRSAAPLVALANGIARRWPAWVSPLEYMHLPLAAGDEPPSLQERYYRPLRNLRLTEGCELVAGLLHEGLNEAQVAKALGMVEKFVSESTGTATPVAPVAVAPSCGYGRRSQDATLAVLRQAAAACTPVGRLA